MIEYNGDIELIFIELPKFTKAESDLVDIIDKWIYFVQNAGSLEYIPETLSTSPAIVHAFDIANMAGLTPEEHEAQWKRRDFIYLGTWNLQKYRLSVPSYQHGSSWYPAQNLDSG